jgi:hypothetical protein
MIDPNQIVESINNRYQTFLTDNPKKNIKDFLKQEVISGKAGLLFLRTFLKNRKEDSQENLRFLAKCSIEKQVKKWD